MFDPDIGMAESYGNTIEKQSGGHPLFGNNRHLNIKLPVYLVIAGSEYSIKSLCFTKAGSLALWVGSGALSSLMLSRIRMF
jgi:hypothetical protein